VSSVRTGGKIGIFVVLLVFVVLLMLAQVPTSRGGVIRLGGFFVLAPLVASALLSFRQTVIICGLTMAGVLILYGGVVHHLPTLNRVVAIILVSVTTAISLLVCRVRLEREERIRRLTFDRDRLTLLTDAGVRVGSTLDTVRTAQELADVAVPRFADVAVVDLFDAVLQGDEPPPLPPAGPITLRRVARSTAGGQEQETAWEPGELNAYPPDSVPGRSLARGQPTRARIDNASDAAGWLGTTTGPPPSARAARHMPATGIAVPLRARGVTLGVAVFVRDARPEPFDADDLLLAAEIGARAAVCVDNARRYSREHRTSLRLQQSLLPKRLPQLAAVETATRYLPAGSVSEMGGDWFDVIRLSGARVALVVGDVLGHGLQASATMGRLRSAVRTLADMDLPPDELLTHLDDVLAPLREEADDGDTAGATGATCLYAIYDPVSLTCTFARAGHPAPVLVLPDGSADYVEVPQGPPLGVGGLPFESAELVLPEDSVLVLYTNGLLSAPRPGKGDDPRAALRAALAHPLSSLDATCDTVIKAMLDGGPADDIALLVARTHGLDAAQVATWDVPTDPMAVGGAREFAARQLAAWGLEDVTFTIELVVSELVTNAIRHGNGPIQLRLIREDALICEVSDRSSISPHLRRAHSEDENGRGLFIIAQLTERWGTRYTRAGKTIWAEIPL
jgi:serine phosphatase RsbU (regulator of sigma subunit)/anti-sigma regulatory factor (Ser/Thr protein kinase)